MKITHFIFCFLCSCTYIFSQDIQVLSKENEEEVPFANIVYFVKDSIIGGEYTDDNGKIKINTNTKYDIIEISAMGYESIKVERDKIAERIYLVPYPEELTEIILGNKKKTNRKTLKMGYPIKHRYLSWNTSKAFEVITLVENTFQDFKKIKYFTFYLMREGISEEKELVFRIIYYKNKNNKPENIHIEDLKKNTFNIKAEQKNKIKIDISNLNIVIPKEGLFIGLEYIGEVDSVSKKFIPTNGNDDKDVFNPSISFSKLKMENPPHAYIRSRYNAKIIYWASITEKNAKSYFGLKENEYYVPAFGIEVYE